MCAQPRRAPDLTAAVAAIDADVARRRADGSTPAITIAVTDLEGTRIDRVYGDAEVAGHRPADQDTLFEIGSIGKTFTALVVMQLAEEGRLGLDDPIVRHLPWFRVPRTGPRITIRHLLSHTGGITAGIDGTPEATFQVWRLRDLPPGCAPGRRYHYSNVGYKTLGLLIEAVEGAPYPVVLRRRLLEPLGMTRTEPEITNAIRPRMAVAYAPARDDRLWTEGLPQRPATWLETATADGCLASTAADMARFARMLLRGGEIDGRRIVPTSAIEAMARPVAALGADGYGLGLINHEVDGHDYLGHTGAMVGSVAGLWTDPAAGLGAVVLQTGFAYSPFALTRLAIRAVAEAREGRPVPGSGKAPRPGGVSRPLDDELAPFTGTFDGPDGRTLRIKAVADALSVDDGARTHPTNPFGDDRWLIADPAWDDALLSFEAGGDIAWHGAVRFVRRGTTPAPLREPSAELRSIAGRYRSHDPWTTNFRVVLRGDVPWLCFPAVPDGFEDEQPLRPLARGGFRVGDDPLGPERIRFDTIIDGRARRAWLSGWDYYRADDTPATS